MSASVNAFWILFAAILFLILFLTIKYNLLSDDSTLAAKKPYSLARAQMAWWTLIIISCYGTIVWHSHELPELKTTVLILLGISSGTFAAGRLSDISDQKRTSAQVNAPVISQNIPGQNFLLDILSDLNGVSIHRFQNLLFNLIFGIWLISAFLSAPTQMPEIKDPNYLVMLGISSAAYAGLKAVENKP